METFKIKESEDYIELNNLIKMLGWVATGGEAKTRIDQEEVRVNGEIETRRRRKIRIGDQVVFGDQKVQIE
jgi:ribosome-associated protein